MSAAGGPALGIDFGTSNTAAVLVRPDGRTIPVLFDGAPLLVSAVCVDGSGRLLVGADARNAARMYPEGFEPNPKRRIDDGEVLLGEVAIAVPELIGAVLARVADEAERIVGNPVSTVTLTHPAAWGPRRREVLTAAAELAGLVEPRLVPEPVAAAAAFVARYGTALPVGGSLLVYDLGAGTFDASVVRRTPDGFDVSGSEGLADTGGLDVDAAVVAYLGAAYADRDPAAWRRLQRPASAEDRRYSRQLWDDVQAAKEMLSRNSSALVPLPTFGVDAPLGREQLEELARPVLDRTLATTRTALRASGVPARELSGVLLVGGSSRIPVVATLLHREFGVAPTTVEQPELIVAEGSLSAPAPPSPDVPGQRPAPAVRLRPVPPAGDGPPDGGAAGPPAGGEPPAGDGRSARGGWRRHRWALLAAVLALALLAGLLTVVITWTPLRRTPGAAAHDGPTATASADPASRPAGSSAPATGAPPASRGQPASQPPTQPGQTKPTVRKFADATGPCISAERTPMNRIGGPAGAAHNVDMLMCLSVAQASGGQEANQLGYFRWDVRPADGTGRVSVAYRLEVYRCDGVRLLPPAGAPGGDQSATGRFGSDEVTTSKVPFQDGTRYYAQLSITSFRYAAAGTTWDTGVLRWRTDCFP